MMKHDLPYMMFDLDYMNVLFGCVLIQKTGEIMKLPIIKSRENIFI